MTKWIVSGLIVVFVGLPLAFGSWFTVAPGQVGIVLRFGTITQVANSGLHFKTPYLDSVEKFDIQTQKEQVDAEAASSDLQTVHTTVAINYSVDGSKIQQLYTTIGEDYKTKVIDPAIQEAVKATTANYTAEQLITKRPAVQDDIKASLVARLSPLFIEVGTVSIINFDFSASFNAAIEAKVTAEQNALAAKNKLDQVKFEAQQTIATAQATAEAQRISSAALAAQGGADYVNLKWIEKWNGQLPNQMIPGQTLPFLNVGK